MARKKSETTENSVAINFRCSPEMKRAVETLTFAGRYENVSKFLSAIVAREIENNRALIERINAESYSVNPTGGGSDEN